MRASVLHWTFYGFSLLVISFLLGVFVGVSASILFLVVGTAVAVYVAYLLNAQPSEDPLDADEIEIEAGLLTFAFILGPLGYAMKGKEWMRENVPGRYLGLFVAYWIGLPLFIMGIILVQVL